MIERLRPQPWMALAATRDVLAALEAEGGPGSARFVGGCVRDALLGRESLDIDLATPLTPPQVLAALERAGIRAVPTGVDHGVVTAVRGGRPYEIATLRRDVETDGRRAVVAYTDSWAEDAARRDFRLNALYAEADGALHDPTGGGLADAHAGRVVFVGDAGTRIREDYLRILRFFRFTAWYGREGFDAAGLAACAALREGVRRLSAERVAKELLKLLAAADPRPAVRAMSESGVLAELLPEGADLGRLEALTAVDLAEGRPGDGALRLAALLPDDPAAVRRAADRLRLSNAVRDRLAATAAPGPRPHPGLDAPALRRTVHALGAAFTDRARLAQAEAEGGDWCAVHAAADWRAPSFPLSGADIAAAGVPQGPEHGRIRRELERWWVDCDFAPDRDALLAELGRLAAAREA